MLQGFELRPTSKHQNKRSSLNRKFPKFDIIYKITMHSKISVCNPQFRKLLYSKEHNIQNIFTHNLPGLLGFHASFSFQTGWPIKLLLAREKC